VLKIATGDIEHILNGYLANYNLKSGDVVVDVGAYLGMFTLYAAKAIGDQGKVIALEAHPLIYELLQDNIKLNSLDNCLLINKGAWSDNTTLKFNLLPGGSSTFNFNNNVTESVVDAPVAKLDDELPKLGINKVNFIKMDVEGAEIEVLKGCQNILKSNNVNLAIASYHILNGQKTSVHLEQLFSKMGYKALTGFFEHQTTWILTFNATVLINELIKNFIGFLKAEGFSGAAV